MKNIYSKLSEKTRENIAVYGATLLSAACMLALAAGFYAVMYHDFHQAGLV